MNTTVCCLCGNPIQERQPVEIAVPLEDGAVQGLWSHKACLVTRLHQDIPVIEATPDAITLTSDEAFQAMFAFLEMQYESTQAEDLGALLGSMSLLPDGGNADPAVKSEWQNAIEHARHGKVLSRLELSTKRGTNEA